MTSNILVVYIGFYCCFWLASHFLHPGYMAGLVIMHTVTVHGIIITLRNFYNIIAGQTDGFPTLNNIIYVYVYMHIYVDT